MQIQLYISIRSESLAVWRQNDLKQLPKPLESMLFTRGHTLSLHNDEGNGTWPSEQNDQTDQVVWVKRQETD